MEIKNNPKFGAKYSGPKALPTEAAMTCNMILIVLNKELLSEPHSEGPRGHAVQERHGQAPQDPHLRAVYLCMEDNHDDGVHI